jgi:cardiolipin synthase
MTRDTSLSVITSLPNLLTLSRIAVIPALIASFYLDGEYAYWVPLALFTIAGLTDILDGYVARAMNEQSSLGKFMDPIADKLLVATTILMLVALDRIEGWTVLPALIIVLREIVVSGLREFLAEIRVSVPVSALGKWKTVLQLVALGFLISGTAGDRVLPDALPATLIGDLGLWVAAVITLISGYDYLRAGKTHLRDGV